MQGNARILGGCDTWRMRYLADARWDGRLHANAYGQVRSLKYTKPCHPSMAGFQCFMPLLGSHSLGVDGADSLAVHAAAVGAAARAGHVRQRRSATVRAGNGLGGLGLPVCAARMSIRARGLVLRQCHCVSSVSFERLSLSVQYLNLCSVQIAKTEQNQPCQHPDGPYSLPSSRAFKPSKAAKRISVTS